MLIAILTTAISCIDPSRYGAVPDDGKPDTAAIQQAIDAAASSGGNVCLGKGVFHVERRNGRKKEWGSLTITKGPLEMYGVGAETVIRMTGPGRKDDWRAIEIKGVRGVYLHDFAIDGLDAYDTEEQTHLIIVAPGSADITINRMALGPMRKSGERVGAGIGGDCIRLLGEIGAEVEDVVITNSTFTNCDRSGISLQRGLRRILIAHNTIQGTGDQEIDFEPTGKGDIQDVMMLDLTLKHYADAQGSEVIAIGGNGKYLARRVTLADSRIEGGGIRIIDVADLQILRNKVDFGAGNKTPVISVMRRGGNIRIAKNTIIRPATAGPGPILAATHLAGQVPRGIALEDNTIQQETASPVVRMTSVGGVVVQRNKIAYTGADATMPIVHVSAVLNDVESVAVTDNEITGDADAVLMVGNRDHRIRFVEVRGNKALRTPSSIRCNGKAEGFENISSDESGARQAVCKGVMLQPVRARLSAPTKLRTPP